MMEKKRYIRFDWAAKYMLSNKADFAIFEGLISVLDTKYKIETGNAPNSFIVRATVKVDIDIEQLKKRIEISDKSH